MNNAINEWVSCSQIRQYMPWIPGSSIRQVVFTIPSTEFDTKKYQKFIKAAVKINSNDTRVWYTPSNLFWNLFCDHSLNYLSASERIGETSLTTLSNRSGDVFIFQLGLILDKNKLVVIDKKHL